MRIIIERGLGSDWDITADEEGVEIIILDRSHDDCRHFDADWMGDSGDVAAFDQMWDEASAHVHDHNGE